MLYAYLYTASRITIKCRVEDYFVFGFPCGLSYDTPEVANYRSVLHTRDMPWESKQVDAGAACGVRQDRYWLYFPGRNKTGVVHIGIADGSSLTGLFTADFEPIKRSCCSINLACFVDLDID